MKRTLFLLMMTLTFTLANAQVTYLHAYALAIKVQYKSWSDWESADVNIKVDTNSDKITIYSNEVQIYKILSEVPINDNETVKFRVIDQDGDYGYVRLRKQRNGDRQIYIDFKDISWVYAISDD